MKKLLLLMLCSITLFAVTESKEGSKKFYTHTVKKILGSAQSLDGARYSAVEGAKQEILEFAGSYMETQSEVVNGKLTKDEILAVTNGVIKTEVVEEKKSLEGDAIVITVTVRCELETDGLEKRIETLLGNKELKQQNQDLVKKNKALLAKIASLEEQSKKATTQKEQKKIEEEFRKTDKKAKAIEYFEESFQYVSVDGSKTENPKKMINLLDKAIDLDPSFAAAYNNRGLTYANLQNYNQAIKDYTKAIDLDPGDAYAYNNKGIAYANLQNYNQAIKDYTKAIDLDPSYAGAYNNRGLTYANLQNYNQAIKDCTKAIDLDPSYAIAYYNRGIAYANLQNYNQAIKDCTKAIDLDPSYAIAYYNRGIAYLISGDKYNGCRDANTACNLGNCKLLQKAKNIGYCQ